MNGRVNPADKKEIADTKARTFVCFVCGEARQINSVGFGEIIKCSNGHSMIDKATI